MKANFYRAFEDRFRGSQQDIKNRFRVYLPMVCCLFRQNPELRIVDLGCGRGEWLSLLKEQGIAAAGVDLDEHMVQPCQERELAVEVADVLSWVKQQERESLDVITAFHLVEHFPFEELHFLLEQLYAILKPGGVLLLETPNPENLIVGATDFYIDPTHKNPIPPVLLSFLCEHLGFGAVKILRLQENQELAAKERLALFDVLAGASRDYAVLSVKLEALEANHPLYDLLEKEYGVKIDTLAQQYQIGLQTEQKSLASLAEKALAESRLAQSSVEAGLERMEAGLARIAQMEQQLQAIYQSKSWRVTAPLRYITTRFRSFREKGAPIRIKGAGIIFSLLSQVATRFPGFRKFCHYLIRKYPAFSSRLLALLQVEDPPTARTSAAPQDCIISEHLGLSHEAVEVLHDFQKVIEGERGKDTN